MCIKKLCYDNGTITTTNKTDDNNTNSYNTDNKHNQSQSRLTQ